MTRALWSSGFRPFFLLGAAYGPLVLLGWLPVWLGWAQPAAAAQPQALWHGHELIYGFAAAFICGFVLTALPSWAGTPEVTGAPLGALALIWLAGRAAAWCYPWVPLAAVAALDLLLFPALAACVLPGLARALDRRYMALLPLLLGFIAADAIYFLAVAEGAPAAAADALQGALDVLVVLFAVIGGLLTPVFTESALQERGQSRLPALSKPVEIAAIASAVLFAAAGWPGVPPSVSGAVACAAALIHAVRLMQWRTLSIVSTPLVLAMHVGYGWLVVAMGLRGIADAFGLVPRGAWIHAFTVGALGMMMLALLNRVALRHTGRRASPSPAAVAGLGIMLLAGLVRVAASVIGAGGAWIAVSAAAWALPFAIFLVEHGAKLCRPSLPRADEPVLRT